MFTLKFSDDFWESYQKISAENSVLQKKIKKTIEQIKQDPKYPSLKTHKVDTKKYDGVWSSWVTGDIRVVWAFDKDDDLVILILELGTHSGSNRVYK